MPSGALILESNYASETNNNKNLLLLSLSMSISLSPLSGVWLKQDRQRLLRSKSSRRLTTFFLSKQGCPGD